MYVHDGNGFGAGGVIDRSGAGWGITLLPNRPISASGPAPSQLDVVRPGTDAPVAYAPPVFPGAPQPASAPISTVPSFRPTPIGPGFPVQTTTSTPPVTLAPSPSSDSPPTGAAPGPVEVGTAMVNSAPATSPWGAALAAAGAGFLLGGPVGAAVGAGAGYFLGKKTAAPALAGYGAPYDVPEAPAWSPTDWLVAPDPFSVVPATPPADATPVIDQVVNALVTQYARPPLQSSIQSNVVPAPVKDNTMLYLGGALALGALYLATRK